MTTPRSMTLVSKKIPGKRCNSACPSIFASCISLPIQIYCVLLGFSFKRFDDIQSPTSAMVLTSSVHRFARLAVPVCLSSCKVLDCWFGGAVWTKYVISGDLSNVWIRSMHVLLIPMFINSLLEVYFKNLLLKLSDIKDISNSFHCYAIPCCAITAIQLWYVLLHLVRLCVQGSRQNWRKILKDNRHRLVMELNVSKTFLSELLARRVITEELEATIKVNLFMHRIFVHEFVIRET